MVPANSPGGLLKSRKPSGMFLYATGLLRPSSAHAACSSFFTIPASSLKLLQGRVSKEVCWLRDLSSEVLALKKNFSWKDIAVFLLLSLLV